MTDTACICGGHSLTLVHEYDTRPEGETAFHTGSYERSLWRCTACSHVLSVSQMPDVAYDGAYLDHTYGKAMEATFRRIIDLPPDKSDNQARVARVKEFSAKRFSHDCPSILDIGSGLCVFLHAMKQSGWDCTAYDVDERSAKHAKEVAGVHVTHTIARGCYDVVTLNKVLEHVKDPVAMLESVKAVLGYKGFVYIELPDAEPVTPLGFNREEFFIEHHHVFSAASLAVLTAKAGFLVDSLTRIHEPSGKYTLVAFLAVHKGDSK